MPRPDERCLPPRVLRSTRGAVHSSGFGFTGFSGSGRRSSSTPADSCGILSRADSRCHGPDSRRSNTWRPSGSSRGSGTMWTASVARVPPERARSSTGACWSTVTSSASRYVSYSVLSIRLVLEHVLTVDVDVDVEVSNAHELSGLGVLPDHEETPRSLIGAHAGIAPVNETGGHRGALRGCGAPPRTRSFGQGATCGSAAPSRADPSTRRGRRLRRARTSARLRALATRVRGPSGRRRPGRGSGGASPGGHAWRMRPRAAQPLGLRPSRTLHLVGYNCAVQSPCCWDHASRTRPGAVSITKAATPGSALGPSPTHTQLGNSEGGLGERGQHLPSSRSCASPIMCVR